VQQAPLPGVRLSTEAPVVDFRPAIQEARGLAQDIVGYEEEQLKRAKNMQLKEAMSVFADQETKLKLDLQKVKGKGAVDAATATVGAFDEIYGEVEKTITHEDVKQQLKLAHSQYRRGLQEYAETYGSGEMEKHEDNTSKALHLNERAAMVADLSPQRIAEGLQRQRETIEQDAERKQLPKEVKDALVREELSVTHFQVINRFLAQERDLDAEAYYDAIKDRDELTDSNRIAIESNLERGSRFGKAQRTVDDWTTGAYKVTDPETGQREFIPAVKSMGDAAPRLKQIEDPKLRKMTHDMLQDYFNEQKQIEREDWNNTYQEAKSFLYTQKKSVDTQSAMEADLARRVEGLPADMRQSLDDVLDAPTNEDKLWLRFQSIASSPDEKVREEITKLNDAEFDAKWWSRFGSQNRTKAEQVRAVLFSAERKEAGAEKKLTELQRPMQIIEEQLQLSEIMPWSDKDISKVQAAKKVRFIDSVQRSLTKFETSLPGKETASDAQIRDIVRNELAKTVTVKGDKRKVADLTEEERKIATVKFEEIPTAPREPGVASSLEAIANAIRNAKQNEDFRYVKKDGTFTANGKKKAARMFAAVQLDDEALYNSALLSEFSGAYDPEAPRAFGDLRFLGDNENDPPMRWYVK
jgi:hypothetical protein